MINNDEDSSSDGEIDMTGVIGEPDGEDGKYSARTFAGLKGAHEAGLLQAKLFDLETRYHAEVSTRSHAVQQVEDLFRQLTECKVARDGLRGELRGAKADIEKFEMQAAENTEALQRAEADRIAAVEWRDKCALSHTELLEAMDRYNELEGNFKSAVAKCKAGTAVASAKEKRIVDLQAQLQQKKEEAKVLKKHWHNVVRLLADISHHSADKLPEDTRDRLHALPIDDLLQIARPDAADSDDEDAEAVHRLLKVDAAAAPRAGRGRGDRGSRGGRSKSEVGARAVIDESLHAELLARKLKRTNREPEAAAQPDQPAAKSVMGKKMETVREQQERQKAGRKDKIAELKAQIDKPRQEAMPVGRRSPFLNDDVLDKVLAPDQTEEDLQKALDDLMKAVDNKLREIEEARNPTAAGDASPPIHEEQGIESSDEEEEEDDEKMEEAEDKNRDVVSSDDDDDDDFEEEDDDEEGEGEYPGLGKKSEASVAGAESYDFSVMDTELEEAKGGQKKRKAAKIGGAPAKKKAKNDK